MVKFRLLAIKRLVINFGYFSSAIFLKSQSFLYVWKQLTILTYINKLNEWLNKMFKLNKVHS